MEISRVDPELEISLTCVENTHQIPSVDDSVASSEDSERLLVCDISCDGVVAQTNRLVLGELESINNSNNQFCDIESDDAAERKLSQAGAEVNTESSKKSNESKSRKRSFTSFEVDSLKRRKLRSNAIPYVKEALKKSMIGSTQWNQKVPEYTGTKIKSNIMQEKDASPAVKSTESNRVLASSSESRDDDTSKAEEKSEYEQCVSLLRIYGVLDKRDLYMSQHHSSCAPHPGYVGDGRLSKRCKTCRALEGGGNMIICDECQEIFHMSCCLPRVSHKYFNHEDDWYCSSCRKQRRRMGSNHYFKLSENGFVDRFRKYPGTRYSSKVRLGPAHQADVPLWTGRIDDDPLSRSVGRPGTEMPISQEAKCREREKILETFRSKVEALNWIPAKMLSTGFPENWLRCRNIFARAFVDHDGQKHNEVICGKWRRAPPHIQQTDHWECFCVMEWDPLHADCAVPQELPTEEIFRRMQLKEVNQRQHGKETYEAAV